MNADSVVEPFDVGKWGQTPFKIYPSRGRTFGDQFRCSSAASDSRGRQERISEGPVRFALLFAHPKRGATLPVYDAQTMIFKEMQ